jgi:hypothetical protein
VLSGEMVNGFVVILVLTNIFNLPNTLF